MGLSEETILEMPVTVFKLYTQAAKRREARERYEHTTAVATAISLSFGDKGARSTLDDLLDDMET